MQLLKEQKKAVITEHRAISTYTMIYPFLKFDCNFIKFGHAPMFSYILIVG